MILDYVENLELPDNLKRKFFNKLQSLNVLRQGLHLLYLGTRAFEQKVQTKLNNANWLESLPHEVQKHFRGKNMKVFTYLNSVILKGVPQDILNCFFHWYSVSACNYVLLVGWILKQVDSNRPEPRKYVESVIPNVLWFRHKIAAHFACAHNYKEDTEANRAVSVIPPITFSDDRFWAGQWKLTKIKGGKKSSSTNKQPWSLTKTHEKLAERYWPKQVRE